MKNGLAMNALPGTGNERASRNAESGINPFP